MKDNWFEKMSPDEEMIRQGDVIKAYSKEARLFVIVTADCDIDKNKHDGKITCVELIDLNDFLESKFYAKKVHDEKRNTVNNILNLINRKSPESDVVNPENIVKWVDREGLEAVCRYYEFGGKDKGNLKKYCAQFNSLISGSNKNRFVKYLSESKKGAGDLEVQIKNYLSGGMGEGYCFVPFIPNENQIGYVISFRDIVTIKDESIFVNESEIRASGIDDGYVRVARLSDYFRFFVSQKMFQLYSRIGMPEYFENESEIAFKFIAEESFEVINV